MIADISIPKTLSCKSLTALVLCASVVSCAGDAWSATVIPDFSTATFVDRQIIDNQYFPLGPDYRATLHASGTDEEGEKFTEESQLSYGGDGRVILGVQTTVQRDRAFEDELLVEDTFDYYAQDTAGNVWYMGEDVTNYVYDDEGNLIETNNASSWIAGINDARPGFIMPANPVAGFAYFQEVAVQDNALDEALIFGTGLSIEASGKRFEDVISILETTSLDPEAREFKYYAPGYGLIRVEEGLDRNLANPELVFEKARVSPVPLPAGFPLLSVGLAALAGVGRCKRNTNS